MAANSGRAKREAAPRGPLPKVLPKRVPGTVGPAQRDGRERLDKAIRLQLETDLEGALRRRPSSELRLAGALRALAPLSPALRTALARACEVLVRRGSFDRDLYRAAIRSLAEADDPRVSPLLLAALASDDAGGLTTLSAACFSTDPALGPVLAKLAASPRAHLAFGAEIARVCRRESSGAHLASLAPMIKESHRIALCGELFVPLLRMASLPTAVASGLAVLRSAERHLGRWLVLGEIAVRAGDDEPLSTACSNATTGPTTARAAWSLVAWALERTRGPRAGQEPLTPARPTVELVSRLSDRPSADRDMTFLFRLAEAQVPSAKAMLEAAVKGPVLSDPTAVRAAMYLARVEGHPSAREALLEAARSAKADDARGLLLAALWGAGDEELRAEAQELGSVLGRCRCPVTLAWLGLVREAEASSGSSGRADVRSSPTSSLATRMVREEHVRWLERGWLE